MQVEVTTVHQVNIFFLTSDQFGLKSQSGYIIKKNQIRIPCITETNK